MRPRLDETPDEAAERVRQGWVFINCPYDDDYRTPLDTLIFAVACCGFLPRSAVQIESSEERMKRIGEALRNSAFSIHDLSRYKGEPQRDFLSRFNMPFELGMAFEMFRAYASRESSLRHEWLALVPDDFPKDKVLSDLGGYDPERYKGREDIVHLVVTRLNSWRKKLKRRGSDMPVSRVIAALADYDSDLAAARRPGAGARDAWNETVGIALAHAKRVQAGGAGRRDPTLARSAAPDPHSTR